MRASRGWKFFNKVGIAAVREKSMRMTARLMEGARARGCARTRPKIGERAGPVSIECPHAYEVCGNSSHETYLSTTGLKAGYVFATFL